MIIAVIIGLARPGGYVCVTSEMESQPEQLSLLAGDPSPSRKGTPALPVPHQGVIDIADKAAVAVDFGGC
jgi:hypothetical protein